MGHLSAGPQKLKDSDLKPQASATSQKSKQVRVSYHLGSHRDSHDWNRTHLGEYSRLLRSAASESHFAVMQCQLPNPSASVSQSSCPSDIVSKVLASHGRSPLNSMPLPYMSDSLFYRGGLALFLVRNQPSSWPSAQAKSRAKYLWYCRSIVIIQRLRLFRML